MLNCLFLYLHQVIVVISLLLAQLILIHSSCSSKKLYMSVKSDLSFTNNLLPLKIANFYAQPGFEKCDGCDKTLSQSSILRHVSKSHACKRKYGDDGYNALKEAAAKRKKIYHFVTAF